MQLPSTTSPTASSSPASPTQAVLAAWTDGNPAGPMLNALMVQPRPDGTRNAELVRVPERDGDRRPATVTWIQPPVHARVDQASAAVRDAILAANLDGFALVSSDRDPRTGYLYLDADAARPTGQYREVPTGALPQVEVAIAELVAALDAHGLTEPLR